MPSPSPPPSPPSPSARSSADAGSGAVDPGLDEQTPFHQDHFRMVADHAPIGIVRTDATGQIVFGNRRWREITGYQDELPVSAGDLGYAVHPDDLERVEESYGAAIANHQEFDIETRFCLDHGEERWVVMRGVPTFTGDGVYDGSVGTMFDITDLRRAQEQQADDEQRYRDLIARSAVGQAAYDLRGVLIEVNRSWAGLLGYDVEEAVGTKALDHVHPDDRGPMLADIGPLLAGEVAFLEQERRLVRKDGSAVWVSSTISLERDRDGEARLFHSMVVDIDERKRVEIALREGEIRYQAVIESMHDGLVVHDGASVLTANRSAARILGLDDATELDLATLDGLWIVDPDGGPVPLELRPSVVAFREGRATDRVVLGIDGLDGDRRWCLMSAVPLFHEDDDDRPYAVALMFNDVTERKLAEDALRASEERFRTLTESIPVGIYRTDISGTVDYVNPRWYEISDASPRDLRKVRNMTRVHPDDRQRVRREMYENLGSGKPFQGQYRLIRNDGDITWVNSRATPVTDNNSGTVTGFVGSLEDITPLITAQEETHRLADIVESTSDLIGIADRTADHFTYLNRSAREQFGLLDTDITKVSLLDLFTDESVEVFVDQIEPVLRTGDHWSGELTMRSVDGEVFNVWQTMRGECDEEGVIARISSVGRDVTLQRRHQEELAFRATHDDLTGLPNRTLLLQLLDEALRVAGDRGAQVALLFVDLDRFKLVNDTLGHTAGDALLIEAANRIGSVLRNTDIVARLGGDEFVILCRGVVDEQHAINTAHRISNVLEHKPFVLDGVEVTTTASIGIALSTSTVARNEATHAEAILRDADAAMYRAKDLGRARLEVFDEDMRRRTAHRLDLTEQLTEAIASGAIVVHYQPCVDLQTGQVTCVEALARWQHPERGVLGPVEFIELAEETGLIVGLGLAVLSQSCRQAYEWEQALGAAMPRVHVNISARQLTATNLPDLVRGVLTDSGLTPHRLCLEITESVLMEDAEAVLETLARLKEIGVVLAIDDFGTGYSSLSYLRRFPVDILKVDHSFVDGLGPDPEDSAIVEAIVGLARTLDLEAIAEGVETEEQVQLLRRLGCGGAQGYHFARPAPADQVTSHLHDGFVL